MTIKIYKTDSLWTLELNGSVIDYYKTSYAAYKASWSMINTTTRVNVNKRLK